MASSNAPKHDFAPAWLKIPNQENPKSSGLKPSEGSDKPSRGRKDDTYHNSYNRYSSDYNRLHRQHSFDNYYEGSKRHPNKFRHHSVDDDYYAYQYGAYPYYNGYNSYEKYNMQYNSQPSLLRPPRGDSKYQHPGSRFGQLNGGYPGYYDLYPYDYYQGDPYYNGYPSRVGSKRSYHDKEGRQPPRDARDSDHKGKDRELGVEKHKAFNDDFPSLNGEKKESVTSKVVNGGGVWDNPPLKSSTSGKTEEPHGAESVPKESPAKSSPSSANIYKALVPNKGNLPRKSRDSLRLNGSYTKEPGAYTGSKASQQATATKEGARQSPTPAIDILSTRLVTQPKNLGDKKSNFLKALRRETNGKGEETEKTKANEKSEEETEDSQIEDDQKELTNGMDCLSVEDSSKDILSSSLEAEQRLLREMGWNEADEEEYEITEDDMKEFQNLSKQVKQQRNGLVRTLPTSWSPKHIAAVYHPAPSDLNDTLSSSDSDSDSGEL